MNSHFLTQPYLLTLNPDREMNILWIQRNPGTHCYVEYGSDETLDSTVEATQYCVQGLRSAATDQGCTEIPEENPLMDVWQYIAVIRGLCPGQRIWYRCVSDGEKTPVYSFHAAPEAGNDFRFVLMSDLQGKAPCDEVVRRIGDENCDFLLYAGDLTSLSWRADEWFDLDTPYQTAEEKRRSFFPCMQQPGSRMMSWCPTFFCPGNHEVNDLRSGRNPDFALDNEKRSNSIFMQLFRPLYPKQDLNFGGEKWYTARYGDLQIFSLCIVRWASWDAYQVPGWPLMCDITENSPQIRWLTEEMKKSDAKYKWVIQHWHLLNKGSDVQIPLCEPVITENGLVSYPEDCGTAVLMPLYEKYGVNAVSFGHSHVYERYYVRNVHYIEAAYMTVCYREKNAPLHPTGAVPVVENNNFRSYVIVDRTEEGLTARAHKAEGEPMIFDTYRIADAEGRS